MINRVLITSLILLFFISCDSSYKTNKRLKDIKLEQIIKIINKSNFLEFPFKIDAYKENSLQCLYNVDLKGNDSLLFESGIYEICGVFPDTTDYYAFLFYSIGDMLYPAIITFNKGGNKIDEQIICGGGCVGNPMLDIKNCYDSIWINSDMTIQAISKFVGTYQTDDSIPNIVDICNEIRVYGMIHQNGNIIINRSDVINCIE